MTGAESHWKTFVRKHWNMIAVFVLAAFLLAVGSVLVFLWFVANAQSSGLVPWSLGSWTMNNLVSFILNAILWEVLLIGVPLVILGVVGWQWWKRLPSDEWKGYRFPMKSRKSRGGGGGSLFFFVAFCIKVYLDGNWNVPIASWNLNYVVNSAVLILIVAAIIVGVPATIFGVWWIRREIKRP